MATTDLHIAHRPALSAPRRDDLARLAIVALAFVNAWLALAHLDPARPDTGATQDWHGNVAASAPR